ncbi:MAG: hypothetical protein IKO42_03740 [Opitutales bacterium]|nr:hypothetical protein [Opitutales bacterium]
MFFKIDAKKFLSAMLAGAAFFMCSCSDGNASANADYVRAVETLEKSFAAFNGGDFAGAAALAQDVEDGIRAVVKKYPESDIALKIVSDPNLHLGDASYADFRKSILPNFLLAGDGAFADFDVAWAIALFSDDAAKVAFAECLGEYPKTLASMKDPSAFKKISSAGGEKIFEKILSDVFREGSAIPRAAANGEASFFGSPRAAVLNARQAFRSSQAQNSKPGKVGAQPAATPAKAPADVKPQTLPPMQNSEKFLAQAQKDAAMASYNLEASARILQASKLVSPSSAEFGEFSKCLDTALANAKKISSKKLRLSALKNIILAMSQTGRNAEALAELASNPDCAGMRQDCCCVIAENLINFGDLKNAEAVVEGLENAKIRSMFYSHLARVKLSKNDFEGAYLSAQKANDSAGASVVMLEQALHLWNSDNKKALEILANVNPQGLPLESLNLFLAKAGIAAPKNLPPHIMYADRYLEIASLLAPADKNAALKWLGLGALVAQNAGAKDAEFLNEKICRILIEIKSGDAVAYASKLRGKIPARSLLGFAESCVARGDKKTALEFFRMASAVCQTQKDAVKVAFSMQASNIEKQEIMKLLGGRLPKFK